MGTNYGREVLNRALGKGEKSALLQSLQQPALGNKDQEEDGSTESVAIGPPWVMDLTLDLPTRILIKTHCTGYGDDCDFPMCHHNYESFVQQCAVGLAPKTQTIATHSIRAGDGDNNITRQSALFVDSATKFTRKAQNNARSL